MIFFTSVGFATISILFLTIALEQSAIDGRIAADRKNFKNPERERIHFNSNGKFKISMFTDLHYGEGQGGDWGPANDVKSGKVMRDILSWENPDFVVFTGDLMSAEVFSGNGSAYVDLLLQPVVEGNYRWASTYGNHDIGRYVTREEILATEQKYAGCYTRQGEDGLTGNTNYYIPVYPPLSAGEGEKPTLMLWFFDSRGGQNASGGIPAYVHENVVEWFEKESLDMRVKWGPIPSLAFFHYPTHEYGPIHDNIENTPECPGQHDDIVTPQEKDTGLLPALAKAGVVRATFVGHNHGNGWCCKFQSMTLCYNRQSGHGGGWVGWTRGSRTVQVSYDSIWDSYSNYVRLENGTVVDSYIF